MVDPLVDVFSSLLITILFDKLFDSQVTTSNSDDDPIALNLHEDSLPSILVVTFRLTDEMKLGPHLLGLGVDVTGQFLVNRVVSYWLVDKDRFRLVGQLKLLLQHRDLLVFALELL
jgi:hypothetical protein